MNRKSDHPASKSGGWRSKTLCLSRNEGKEVNTGRFGFKNASISAVAVFLALNGFLCTIPVRAEVYGRVVRGEFTGIEGARVTLAGTGQSVLTDQEGYWSFKDSAKPSGSADIDSLIVEKDGYVTTKKRLLIENGEGPHTILLPVKDDDSEWKKLWANYDPAVESLEVEILRDCSKDPKLAMNDLNGLFVRFVIATWKGEKAYVAGRYIWPKKGDRFPALLHLHGGGMYAFYEWKAARQGYAVMSINWGAFPNRTPMEKGYKDTDYGAINPNVKTKSWQPGAHTIDDFQSPRNDRYYAPTIAAMRAITYLRTRPEVDASRIGVYGFSMGGILTTLVAGADSRVKVAIPQVGGTAYWTYDMYGSSEGQWGMSADTDIDLYRKTRGIQVYAPNIQCPIMFMGATNDFNGPMDLVYRTYKLLPHDNYRYTFAPHKSHGFTPEASNAFVPWLAMHLKGGPEMPETPASQVILSDDDGVPRFVVVPDKSMPVKSVELYYSQDLIPKTRVWLECEEAQSGDSWTAKCPVKDRKGYLFAFANAIYENGEGDFSLSSELHVITPRMLAVAGAEYGWNQTDVSSE